MISILLCYKKGHNKIRNTKADKAGNQEPGESPHILARRAVLFIHTNVNLHSVHPLVHADLGD